VAGISESLRVGVATLRINPLRTFLSTLGVVIGVASLVAVLSLGDGMESFARREIDRTTMVQNVFVETISTDTVDGVPIPRQRVRVLGAEDAEAARLGIRGHAGVVVAAHGTTWFADPSGARRATRVTATTASAGTFNALEVAGGRFFSTAEDGADAPVVVVSQSLARALSPAAPAAAIGRSVPMQGGPRTVVGVLADRGAREGMAAFIPLRSAERVLTADQARRPRSLVVKAARVEDVAAVRGRVEAWLERRYGAGWRREFVTGTDEARSEQMRRAFIMIKLFMGSLTAISLLVGGIGIMNVLLASVTERTREIGIRKAVGARGKDIVLQFLTESVTITGAGSFVGMLLGLAGASVVTAIMRVQTQSEVYPALTLATLAVAALSALLVGTVFGIYPALRAARLSPIEAIRHE
jgi:putative ABC transport system permease protein